MATTEAALKAAPSAAPDFAALLGELNTSFASGRTQSLDWRRRQLAAMSRMMRECEDEFAAALKTDLGKAHAEAWATEISFVDGDAAYFRKHLRKFAGQRRVPTPAVGRPGKSWIQPEPKGTVLIMGAWNYPLQLSVTPMAAAIAAGNCIVLKPSELSPATADVIAKRVPQYMDEDCVRVVCGGITESTALLEQHFDHILYTGGAAVARIVMVAAAKHLTPVTLELGGKSPCIVLPDANLKTAAKRIAWGKFLNAGQTCIAPDYVLTDVVTEEKLVPLIEEAVREMYGDNPQQSQDYGRIVNERHFDRISRLIDREKLAFGGQTNAEEKYIAPTVLRGISPEDPVMGEEIFGPVLPVVRSESLADAIRLVNRGDKPLAAYLFSNSRQAEKAFLAGISCGSACVNDTMMFMTVPGLPFGGIGESGMGVYSGQFGFDTFSNLKAVLRRGVWPDPSIRYAPYEDWKLKLLRKLR